ncbi:MAG: hypothetical protein J4215_04545 [Candidatus Diapherotrites archaeon]|uniref:RNA-binding protein n=1 Tax=Candidatus Iainarchaeum sp. TaxID=3101447 RepID=A0A8T4L3D2_9ARCH|nr:hypothetical protein [Candidatus Diapherotrites archaeon]
MTKKIVVPGELVTEERKRLGEHVYIRDGKIFSDTLGISRVEGNFASVVPLRGKYVPQMNDLIVGIVAQEVYPGYLVDVNGVNYAFVSKKELRDPLQVGTVVSAKVMSVNETHDVELGFVRVFYGGTVIPVMPVKVPRMIGKNGSMLEVLKRGTGCNVMIGRNGFVWVKGGDMELLKVGLQKIDDEAHLSNLTNKMSDYLKKDAPVPASGKQE